MGSMVGVLECFLYGLWSHFPIKKNCFKKLNIKVLEKVIVLSFIFMSNFTTVFGITNGIDVYPPGKFPFVINADLCSAVLVSPNVAIGVASCCYNKVLIGAHNVSKAEVGQEEFEVAETISATGENKPYRFIHDENSYDIVILRLNGISQHSPIDINDFAPLVYDGTSESEDLELVLAGWGSSRRGDPSSETLKEVSLDLIPVVPCKQIYSKRKETWYGGGRRDLVCAARTVNGETSGPCSGDSGAPLINMKNGKLVGIVTTRFVFPGCDDEDYPGVFTSVHFYRDWIDSHIKKFSCPWFETLKYPNVSTIILPETK